MTHPLIERLLASPGTAELTTATLDEWLARPGDRAIFLAGDPVRFPEALDVAVVLPELKAAFVDRFEVGVASHDDEDTIARRFGVQRWPSLVFVRGGGYVATISGMQDWDEYLRAIAAALEAPVTRAPSVGIPVVRADAAPACH